MLSQVGGRLVDASAINAWAAPVGPYPLPCRDDIVSRTNLLHQKVISCRAFEVITRHKRFGPFISRAWGFTPALGHEGQF
jgi:hypothetical protein